MRICTGTQICLLALLTVLIETCNLLSVKKPHKDVAMFKIEKDVPLVEKDLGGAKQQNGRKAMEYRYGKAAPWRPVFPFREMEVGDSIFFPDEPKGSRSNPCVSARIHGARYGKKFSGRKEGDGVRVWRVE